MERPSYLLFLRTIVVFIYYYFFLLLLLLLLCQNNQSFDKQPQRQLYETLDIQCFLCMSRNSTCILNNYTKTINCFESEI